MKLINLVVLSVLFYLRAVRRTELDYRRNGGGKADPIGQYTKGRPW